MQLNRIHHIAIICSNFKVSKNFYVNILGLKPISEVYREERNSYKLDLAVNGEYQIELFSFDNPPKRPSYPEASGLRHLAFEVDNIEEAVMELTTYGVKVEEIRVDVYTNKKYTFFADPDDLPMSCISHNKSPYH
ncbi:MAG: VOC family protein [Bacillaceae bacterium]|nr:VOC family protein [Bacillaceae bacterium]